MNQRGFLHHLTALVVVAVVAVGAIGFTVYRHNATNAYAVNYPKFPTCKNTFTIGVGNLNDCVGVAQTILNNTRCANPALTPDKNFGPLTRAATQAYQRKAGLTADGVIGPNTWHSLLYNKVHCSAADSAPKPPAVSNGFTTSKWTPYSSLGQSRKVYKNGKLLPIQYAVRKTTKSAWQVTPIQGYPNAPMDPPAN